MIVEIGAASMGMCMGSFICCAISRKQEVLERGFFSAMDGRSHCDSCGCTVDWIGLIPVLGWLIRGGRCKECKAKIPWVWPVLEICAGITGVMLVAMDWKYAVVLALIYLAAVFDVVYEEVPYLVSNGVLAVATLGALSWGGPKACIAGVVMFVMFWIIYQIRPGCIGGADVKILAAMVMGYPIQSIGWCLFGVSGLGLIWLLLARKKQLKLVPVLWIVYLGMYWLSL